MNQKYMIDAHCHLFTQTMFTSDISNLVSGLRKNSLPFFRSGIGKYTDKHVQAFLDTAYDNDPESLYNIMKAAYGEEFLVVPLMLDLVYTMERPSLDFVPRKTFGDSGWVREELMRRSYESQMRFISWLGRRVSPDEEKTGEPIKRVNFFRYCYEVQLRELLAIKEKMPNRVFPFYSIDPRRNPELKHGVLGEIKKNVGPDKPFIGLKLYPSLGYSPTHPVLFDGEDSVYSWCERNQIPVTVHFADAGFSNILSELRVEGDIYDPESGDIMPSTDYAEDKIVRYKTNYLVNTDEMIKERQLLHNHPKLWYKVLKRYPKLKIDFAHFGGSDQLRAYTRGEQKGFWTRMVIDLMKTYPNVYTDLSCFYYSSEGDFTLKEFYENTFKKLPPRVKRRVMYGSDFYMVLLFRPSLKGYIIEFKREFGKDFKVISMDNPSRFLGLNKRKIKATF